MTLKKFINHLDNWYTKITVKSICDLSVIDSACARDITDDDILNLEICRFSPCGDNITVFVIA